MLKESAGYIVLAAAGVLGWIVLFFSRRDRRIDREKTAASEARATKAEAELAALRRRSVDSSPYLQVSDRRFNGVQFSSGKHGQEVWIPAGGAPLLCFLQEEIPEAATLGQSVFLAVENEGRRALEVFLKLDGERVILNEVTTGDASGVSLIEYPYDPDKRGRKQVIEMSYLAVDGTRDVQRYETKHGVRWLKRIDPG